MIKTLLRKILGQTSTFLNLIRSMIHLLFGKHVVLIFDRIRVVICRKVTTSKINHQLKIWITKNYPNSEELEKLRLQSRSFSVRPKISILCPTYNTPEHYLRACIDSVLKQSYDHWELCLTDDASEDSNVRRVIHEYCNKEPRIKCVLRKERGHISQASNDALNQSSGDFVGFLDHDDILWPHALYEVVKTINENTSAEFIYSDEDKLSKNGNHCDPFFKPDWSPHYLRSRNYIAHFAVIKKSLIEHAGKFRTGFEGAQDWDLFLRVTRVLDRGQIVHIPKILYSWRQHSLSAASSKPLQAVKAYAHRNQKRVLLDDLEARGHEGDIILNNHSGTWRVKHKIVQTPFGACTAKKDSPDSKGAITTCVTSGACTAVNKPLVSIIIPTKDKYKYIEKCLISILEKTTYPNYELVIVDTGSTEQKTWTLYEDVRRRHAATKILSWKEEFNFAAVCNFGVGQSSGEYSLLLNNDTEVITPDWIEGLLEYAQLPEIGAVGCLLFYPNNQIQHAGVILGIKGPNLEKGVAGHVYAHSSDTIGMRGMIQDVRNFSAVTAACLMVKKKKYLEVNGQDPVFKIAFNDVDLCLKLFKAGYLNVYIGHVQLFHHESISIGKPHTTQRDKKLFQREIELMQNKWGPLLQNDPFYNKNLTLIERDFSLRI